MLEKIKNFKRFSFIATAATYFLIFVGGLVRVSGAGLGCPDWPKCFGRWIPPTNAGQLPPDMDPSMFNFTLAWIEYINRLVGVTIGFLIVIVAFLAIKNFRNYPRIIIPSILAALLVAFQGWQGSRVVASELEPIIVTTHMVIAFIIVSLLLYVSLQAHRLAGSDAEKNTKYPAGMKLWIGLLWVMVIIQVMMGTQVRSAIEINARQFPQLTASDWLDKVGMVSHTHSILGVMVIFLAFFVVFKLLAGGGRPSLLVRQSSISIIILICIQLLLGIVLYIGAIPPVMQVLHLWIASLITGLCLILYTAMKKEQEN
ncbi:MAG: COX15/CtaA family protein [Candidatus Zixiibacteriota bacterium]